MNNSVMNNSAKELSININKIINMYLTKDKVNELIEDTGKHINNSKITINNAVLYFFYSVFNNTYKSDATDFVNSNTNKKIDRTSYSRKEKSIPAEIYKSIQKNITDLCNSYIQPNTSNNLNTKLIAIDGTNCLDDNYNVSLSMGFYDVTNDIPIEFILKGSKNRNKEIKCTTDYIKNNINDFNDVILIFDRGYYSGDFMDFLDENNIKFLIRARGNANNLNELMELGKNVSKKTKEQCNRLRKKIKIIHYKATLTKTINVIGNSYPNKKSTEKPTKKPTKKPIKKQTKEIYEPTTYVYESKNDYVFVTNLLHHSDDEIKKIYESRWEVEVFYKLIKNNFDIKIFKKRNQNVMTKVHSCSLIITSLMKLFKKRALVRTKMENIINKRNGTKVVCKLTINESETLRRLKDKLLFYIITGTLTEEIIIDFETNYCKVIKVELNREYPRESKTPFSKWYVKMYSATSEIAKILRAIETETVNKLHPNKQSKAKNITIIDSYRYVP